MIISVALLDDEMVARQPERHSVIELQVRLIRWLLFPCNRPPANDERQIAEPERSMELRLKPGILGSDIRVIDCRSDRFSVGVLPVVMGPAQKLARRLRRASDLIEELGRDKSFYLGLAGGSGSHTAPAAVFPDASHAEHVAQ